MNIQIINHFIQPDHRRLGVFLVKYHDLAIQCDLVYHVKDGKFWVRMPEAWFIKDKKTKFCFWQTKELSDKFQEEVLKLIFSPTVLTAQQVALIEKHTTKRKVAA
jgi:hypothetical protein